MKPGDLVQHWDPGCGTGVVLEDSGNDQQGILILWSDGLIEWSDRAYVKLLNKPHLGITIAMKGTRCNATY